MTIRIRRSFVLDLGLACVLATALTSCSAPPEQPEAGTPEGTEPVVLTESQKQGIDQATGAQGAYTPGEEVYKVSFPRNDVPIVVDGRPLPPFLGVTSWAAFTPITAEEAMVMGDLTLFEDEVNPVMSVLLGRGLEVTALHNHFFFDEPRVMFMHIGGHGAVEQLAEGVRAALDQAAAIREASPQPVASFPGPPAAAANSISSEALDQILGAQGTANNGMYKVAIGRPASVHGREIGTQMGVNTWAAFAGSDENASVDGDFAMTASELQGVLRALRAAGINIVAIHNHMTHEEPAYLFLHYWGKGPAADLARGLKSALDTLGSGS